MDERQKQQYTLIEDDEFIEKFEANWDRRVRQQSRSIFRQSRKQQGGRRVDGETGGFFSILATKCSRVYIAS